MLRYRNKSPFARFTRISYAMEDEDPDDFKTVVMDLITQIHHDGILKMDDATLDHIAREVPYIKTEEGDE